MNSDDSTPVFPFVPDAVTRTSFVPYEHGDFPTEAHIEDLMHRMWSQPETEFYYYRERDAPLEASLLNAVQRGLVRADHSVRRYYRHPKFERDYVRIARPIEALEWDWEKEVVAKGPEFWRTTLLLSAFARNHLDTKHKIELEEEHRQAQRRARYSYDAFLSYSTSNAAEAELIHKKAIQSGLRVFMAPKVLQPGDDFAEEIRASLEGSAELWLLLSPQSATSEWVISEWGAAWVLRRPIVPILHRCEPAALPDRLARYQCVDLHRIDELMASRSGRRPGGHE